MPKSRPFPFPDTQAGVFHVVSRIAAREFLLQEAERDFFTKTVHAYAELLGVQVLTHCTMSNHFHLLVRVPHRPEMPEGRPAVEELLMKLERAVGAGQMKLLRLQLQNWQDAGALENIEAWRQRQIGAMYSLSEFVKRVKQRFARWYNKRTGRTGVLWEDRYKSTIVEDEERALRMMATYIDLNPVRAGITDDPGNYRWSGYAEAMAGSMNAREGIAYITGATAARATGRSLNEPAPVESESQRKRRQLKALVHYRQMLGVAGRPGIRADGKEVRRGLSAKVLQKLESENGIRRELLLKRVQHFTRGVIFGSREFINGWFERNRSWFKGGSAEKRKTGARAISKDWKGLYNLRKLTQ
jgi:putative transposase